MTKIVMQKMVKIVAVSMMSAIVSISFNGCGFFGSSTGEIQAESCNGEGVVTIREQIEENGKYVNTMTKGECKNGLKEGLWKYYDANNSSRFIQEVTFASGIRNGVTKKDTTEYYINGKMVGEIKDRYLYLYEENSRYVTRYRKYNIYAITNNLRDEHNERVKKIEWGNMQIEEENKQMQREANVKYEEAKAKAQEIAKQRAESKVKKPTMQEVKKSKSVMDTYRAKLQAQVEKELQIELSKIQAPQAIQKQTIEIPPYKEPKLDTYEEILAFVKDKKYTFEEKIVDGFDYINIDARNERRWKEIESSQDSDGKNFESEIKAMSRYVASKYESTICRIANGNYNGKGCWEVKKNYKWLLEKSIFKDKINAILPN